MAKPLDTILKERQQSYGNYKYQAKAVGEIIQSVLAVGQSQGKSHSPEFIGSIAYIATKLARLGFDENHKDSRDDLVNYCKLFRDLKDNQ